jgi:ribosomal protein L7/L12
MDDFARAQIEALKRRVEDLEHHMRLVYEHAGLDTSALHRDAPPVDPHLVEMLRAGRMVQAIKVYADTHGVDLMTAKTAIERIHAEGNY